MMSDNCDCGEDSEEEGEDQAQRAKEIEEHEINERMPDENKLIEENLHKVAKDNELHKVAQVDKMVHKVVHGHEKDVHNVVQESNVDEEQFEVHKVVQEGNVQKDVQVQVEDDGHKVALVETSVHKVVQVEDDVHKDVLDVEDVHKVVQQDKHKVAVEDEEHKVAPVEFDMHKVAENGEHKVALAVYHKVDTDDDRHKVDENAVDHKVDFEMPMSSGDVYANDLQDSDASSMSSMFSKYDMYQNNEEVSLSDDRVDGGIVPSYDMNSNMMLAVENFEQGGVLECEFYARQFTSESGANTI